MAYFAKLDSNNKVINVIVAEQDFINTQPGKWQPADYTGVNPKNYPGIGYTWNASLNGYVPPQPFSSWTLNNTTCLWQPPVSYPTDGNTYKWDETTVNWVQIPKMIP